MKDFNNFSVLLEKAFPGQQHRFFSPLSIGDSAGSADLGVELILLRIKTATSSAFWEYTDGNVPFVGALSVLLDGRAQPKAVLETSSVAVIPFAKIDEDFAYAYGEGDRSLSWFRKEIGFWYEKNAQHQGYVFNEETLIVCERFSVVLTLDNESWRE